MQNFSANSRGAIFMTLAMAGYVFNDALMKLVSSDLPLFQAILIRGIIACVLMFFLTRYMGQLKLDKSLMIYVTNPAILLRTFAEAAATFFFLTALFHMPIANVSAMMQLLPLTLTLGAAIFFGEKVGWRRYSAILIGFFGVLLIIQPGGDNFNVYSLYGLGATACVTLRDLATRKLPEQTSSLTVSLLSAIIVTIMGGVGTLFESWQTVETYHVFTLAGAACILMVGYVFSIMAMREGDVSFVSPFRYSILLWALLLGYFIFDDIPTAIEGLGAIIVVGSGLFTFYRERLAESKAKKLNSTMSQSGRIR